MNSSSQAGHQRNSHRDVRQRRRPGCSGLHRQLGRPGRNITGLSMLFTELSGKRLELLKQAVANLERVAVLAIQNFPP
jgi:ABC-type uncharacterized transport system substrate-binding protein